MTADTMDIVDKMENITCRTAPPLPRDEVVESTCERLPSPSSNSTITTTRRSDRIVRSSLISGSRRYRRRSGANSFYLLSYLALLSISSFTFTSHTSPQFRNSNMSRFLAEAANNGDDAVADDAVDADEADGEVEDNEVDDPYFVMGEELDFDQVSIMPVSCVNYHNGHMIKFQFFEKSSSLNCHFKNLGTFVVSIAHYMRAYFNYQALMHGNDFTLPGDVGFLNCVMLKETQYSDLRLYAKIGCQHRDTYTSTKLQLIVYRDAQCSQIYQQNNNENNKRNDGYDIDGYFLSNKVSFRPPFYSCQSCLPEEISDKFTKRYSAWYDDDYISRMGKKKNYNDDGNQNQVQDANENANDGDGAADDANNGDDDGRYYQANDDINSQQYDDAVAVEGDDAANNNDDGGKYYYNHYVNHDDEVYYNYRAHDDDFYAMDDDARRMRRRMKEKEVDASHSITAKEALKEYEADFNKEMALIHRQLEVRQLEDADNADNNNANGNNGYQNDVNKIANWNMCERVHHYGMWCDEDCRSLDTFRVDEWSRSDVFLLVIMCVFMGAMMLLIFAKRVKAYERAAMWGDEPGAPNPGLPPMAMLMIFAIVFTLIVVLACLKFVNETLVFAVVTCILLFIYMLKLTLFESRKPQFLPARSTRNHSLKEPFY